MSRFRLKPARPHGTHYRYTTGCRCDECRRGEREYDRDLRRRKKTGDVWDHTTYTPSRSLLKAPNTVSLARYGGREWVEDMRRVLAPDETADLVEQRQLVYAHRVDRQPRRPPFANELDGLEKMIVRRGQSKEQLRKARQWAKQVGRGW